MNGIDVSNLHLLLSTAEYVPSGLDLLAQKTERTSSDSEARKRSADEEDPGIILSNLSKVARTMEDKYETQIAAPFLLKTETLLMTFEEFSIRLFSPTPPNNKSKVYKEWLENEVWEYDLIIDWLGSQFKDEVAQIKNDSPSVYRFLKENLNTLVKGMDALYERYEDLHDRIVSDMRDFETDLKQLRTKVILGVSDFNKDEASKNELIEGYEALFEGCEESERYFSQKIRSLNRDLRTMQDYFQASANVYQIPFSPTHSMAFPYIAEDRYYYLSPPSADAPSPTHDYDIIQMFFKSYQKSFCIAHNNHFQFLLGRTIEMRNISLQVFQLREEVVSALRSFSENL